MVPLGRYVEQQPRQGPRSPSSERATDQYWEGGPHALRARASPSTAGSSHQADTHRGEPGRGGPVLEDTAEAAWVPYDNDQYRVRCRHRRSHEGLSTGQEPPGKRHRGSRYLVRSLRIIGAQPYMLSTASRTPQRGQ